MTIGSELTVAHELNLPLLQYIDNYANGICNMKSAMIQF